MLLRYILVLRAYHRARARGDKRSAAIAVAVSTVRSRVPGMPISETEVKRVLAFESKYPGRAWIISPSIVRGPELDLWFDNLKWVARESPLKLGVPQLPDYRLKPKELRTFRIQIGQRPVFSRSNARKSAAHLLPCNPGALNILP
jgi:hypothetical protein